jgi:hypothetical protein
MEPFWDCVIDQEIALPLMKRRHRQFWEASMKAAEALNIHWPNIERARLIVEIAMAKLQLQATPFKSTLWEKRIQPRKLEESLMRRYASR